MILLASYCDLPSATETHFDLVNSLTTIAFLDVIKMGQYTLKARATSVD